jgi:hypothetical protein
MPEKIKGHDESHDAAKKAAGVVDDSNLLLKKVKDRLPSLSKTAGFARVIICWEVAQLILEFML